MIAWLDGQIIEKNPPQLILSVNGVGYLVELSMNAFFQLPNEGERISLYIHNIIREDANLLFGFVDKIEQALFRQCIKVSGIGPKLGLAILSGMNCQEFMQCITTKNTTALNRIPGVGKKTAERLVIEMQDNWKQWEQWGALGTSNLTPSQASTPTPNALLSTNMTASMQEAASALTSLGYKLPEITKVMEVLKEETSDDQNCEYWIRGALKYFNRR